LRVQNQLCAATQPAISSDTRLSVNMGARGIPRPVVTGTKPALRRNTTCNLARHTAVGQVRQHQHERSGIPRPIEGTKHALRRNTTCNLARHTAAPVNMSARGSRVLLKVQNLLCAAGSPANLTRHTAVRYPLGPAFTSDHRLQQQQGRLGNPEAHGEHPFCVEVQLVIAPAHKCHAGDSIPVNTALDAPTERGGTLPDGSGPRNHQISFTRVTHGPFHFTGSTYPTAYPNAGNTISDAKPAPPKADEWRKGWGGATVSQRVKVAVGVTKAVGLVTCSTSKNTHMTYGLGNPTELSFSALDQSDAEAMLGTNRNSTRVVMPVGLPTCPPYRAPGNPAGHTTAPPGSANAVPTALKSTAQSAKRPLLNEASGQSGLRRRLTSSSPRKPSGSSCHT